MISRRATQNVALTIAGSDSGGGAGVQADLKTFAALGVHGTSAITCITAQNPERVVAMEPCSPAMVRRQIEAVFAELPPAAVKTGMLFSAQIVRVVAEFFAGQKRPPLIVDPVMVATSGKRLLKDAGVAMLQARLLPRATLVTPNLAEAQILSGAQIESPEDMRQAARRIRERFGCAVLVKGGHLHGSQEAVDIFYDGRTEWLLQAPFVRSVRTHGTGCTYAAAIAAYVARGHRLVRAVELAKRYITEAISRSVRVAGHAVLRHSP